MSTPRGRIKGVKMFGQGETKKTRKIRSGAGAGARAQTLSLGSCLWHLLSVWELKK